MPLFFKTHIKFQGTLGGHLGLLSPPRQKQEELDLLLTCLSSSLF